MWPEKWAGVKAPRRPREREMNLIVDYRNNTLRNKQPQRREEDKSVLDVTLSVTCSTWRLPHAKKTQKNPPKNMLVSCATQPR